MNKEDNVYFTLAQQFKELKSSPMQIYAGNITSVAPLLISCAGTQLDRKDLLINKDILKGTKRNVKINNNDSTSTIENTEDKFKVGSKVVLLTQDNQKFYFICEVE